MRIKPNRHHKPRWLQKKSARCCLKPYLLTISHEGGENATVEHHCTASIGVVVFFNHEKSHNDILKWADVAMYKAKAAGRNLIRVYDSND